MKQLLSILLLAASSAFSCGPYFPPSYLSDLDSHFIENINVTKELVALAEEYGLLDQQWHPSGGSATSASADQLEFYKAANATNRNALSQAFDAYAKAIRSGATNQPPFEVPAELREFSLYLEGVAEMIENPEVTEPEAWDELLALPATNRHHRTVWVHYMHGNLAARTGNLAPAAAHWQACRTATAAGFADATGLANASFKTEYLAQTNLADRIHYGVKAVAYYEKRHDRKKLKQCMEFLRIDALKIVDTTDPIQLETAALFQFGNPEFIRRLNEAPPLQITPRLAWFMYKRGDIEKAEAYLACCPVDDPLATWLRFRIAQRNGQRSIAISHLKNWLQQLRNSNRVFYEFQYYKDVSPRSAAYGNLGTLFASQNQMMDALACFVEAGAYQDAALIAERYVETEKLRQYVDTFASRPSNALKAQYYYETYKLENSRDFTERHLAYLLARRLFREDRAEDALPYYPPALATLLQTYLEAIEQSERFRNTPNVRSAHLYHASRILRWKGMELSGTEFGPDYRIVDGLFDWSGTREQIKAPTEIPEIYKETAPTPDIRFHYRHRAAELALRAEKLSWNRHQKATILWSAGTWLKTRHPNDADVYYKKLAKIRFQPLAQAADKQRWFPESTHQLSYVHRSMEYIEPKLIAKAAKEYGK
jgi:hypothetical protein